MKHKSMQNVLSKSKGEGSQAGDQQARQNMKTAPILNLPKHQSNYNYRQDGYVPPGANRDELAD